MKKLIIIISACIVVLVLLLTIFFITRTKTVLLQGVSDSKEIKISSRVPGRVDQIYVKEGDQVNEGQILVTIDAPDLHAKALQAAAATRAATAQKTKADTGARKEEIEAAFNLWQKAVVGERVAKQTNERVKQLFNDGVVSAQQRDEAQAQYDAAKQDTLAAKAQYDMATKGVRTEDKEAAEAMADQAVGALKEVESYLDDTVLSSPIDGEVSVVVLNKGELAGSGTPLLTIIDLSDVYFVFNIREDLMPNFKMHKKFDVMIPAIDNAKHELEITFIAPRGDFATWSATKSTGQFDLRTFEVRAKPTSTISGLRPGMSAIYYLPAKKIK